MLGMDAAGVVESLLRTSTRIPDFDKYLALKAQVHRSAGSLACSPLMGCAGQQTRDMQCHVIQEIEQIAGYAFYARPMRVPG